MKIIENKSDYKFSDLVDIDEFIKLLDSFYKATGIPNGLVGNDGTIISQSGWTDACNLFHRTNLKSKQFCEESNLCLMEKLKDKVVSSEKCKNGLIDYATPIEIEGNRLATLFLGQVLNEKPNIAFAQQAKTLNYDEKKYLESINKIPIVSEKQMELYLDNMLMTAQMLAKIGLAKLNEKRLRKELKESNKKTIHLKDILDFSPVGIGWSTIDDKVEYLNHQFTKQFGYTIDDIPTLEIWYKKAYPDEKYRKEVIKHWEDAISKAQEEGISPAFVEVNIRCKDGSEKGFVFEYLGLVKKG